ncbi:hypothetical protein CERSUDRAFT_92190 [Gelatoporia subvermispora B]|uniref:Epoxide hydrolase N-terminal domain-containing protein n=1 Tax=Ceriporiopsis subvermispora (strain B) TaxID=914234 RepID=M2RMJ8_CERS8|nr:hypothetical protein CERSUDRAFT_92190 [Gelatoporia subvermispora B]
MKRLVERWKDGYDWRKAEAEINSFPQFTRDIEVEGFGTLNIHYVHQKSTVKNAIPLLFVHGWPGHFMEAHKLIPLLTAVSPDHPSFHVVSISLPGFGFSEAPKKGFAQEKFAEVGNKLMFVLGYNEYVTQGGDWGYFITRIMASVYGRKSVEAWHTNFPVTGFPSFFSSPLTYLTALVKPYTSASREGLARTGWYRKYEWGYFEEQSTRPQTLGYAVSDSPAGFLAWIYEKLVQWTDGYPWEDEKVLTWVSIYWFSRAGPAASFGIYAETLRAGGWERLTEFRSNIPLGLSSFPKELVITPVCEWARANANIVSETEHEHGGHFASHEQPEKLANDVRKMYMKGGPAYGVVSGKDGYAP